MLLVSVEQMGGAAATAEFAANGVVGAKPLLRIQTRDVVKTTDEIWGKR